VCGGSIDNMYSIPSSEPSISSSPTVFCEDVPGWYDSDVDNCDDYDYYQWCEDFGDSFSGLYNLTANEACCVCGGSIDVMMSFPSSNPSTSFPTQTPTLSSSPTASPHPTVFCEDVSDWVDTWNNNCDDYASNNMCKYYYVIGTN